MKKSGILLLAVVLSVVAILTGCGANGNSGNDGNSGNSGNSGNNASKKVLKIGNAPYDYETPLVEITKIIAEEKGYEVEVVKGDIAFQFLGLVNGDIDAWPGVWLPAIHASYHEKYGDQYEVGGAIFEEAPTGWVVPKYVDIDSIADIKGKENIFKGKFTGFEPGSGMMLVTKDVIDGYDLDLELMTGTMASMLAEADYAMKQQEPIVFLGWRPHTMFSKYDLKMLEDPLGYWEKDDYLWGYDKGFKDKAPDMYKFLNNLQMSIDDVEQYLYNVQEEKQDPTEMAKKWIEDNRTQIDAWLEG